MMKFLALRVYAESSAILFKKAFSCHFFAGRSNFCINGKIYYTEQDNHFGKIINVHFFLRSNTLVFYWDTVNLDDSMTGVTSFNKWGD